MRLDVCELLVPALSPRSGLVAPLSAFGPVADELVRDGKHVARSGASGLDVRGWTSLGLERSINTASEHDETWVAYLQLLRELIGVHDTWMFAAEADCDQHPIDRAAMTVDALLDRLDRARRERDSSFALVAWSPAGHSSRQ
jgi:hypothetical protein